MKTNFEKVKAICDSGKIAVVETFPGETTVFYAIFKTPQGDYRYGANLTKVSAIEIMGDWEIYEDEINDLNIVKIHQPINFPTHNIKVGDKVRILECARDMRWFKNLSSDEQEMIGKSCIVNEIVDIEEGEYFYVGCDDSMGQSLYSSFPLSCVCLDLED